MCSRYLAICLHAAVIASLVSSSAAARPARGLTAVNTATGSAAAVPLEPRPTTANCSELFFQQRVDQFDFNSDAPTWQQRYFLCPQFANGSGTAAPPILFLGAVAAASAAALITTVKWYGGAHHMPNCTCSRSRQRGGRAESRKHQRATVGAGPRPGRPARVCRGEQKGREPFDIASAMCLPHRAGMIAGLCRGRQAMLLTRKLAAADSTPLLPWSALRSCSIATTASRFRSMAAMQPQCSILPWMLL